MSPKLYQLTWWLRGRSAYKTCRVREDKSNHGPGRDCSMKSIFYASGSCLLADFPRGENGELLLLVHGRSTNAIKMV